MSARLVVPILVVIGTTVSGCAGYHQIRHAPLGDPPVPAAQVAAVRTSESYQHPGSYHVRKQGDSSPTVTRDGVQQHRDGIQVDEAVRWDIRLSGGAGVDVLAMMWSPASTPRCEGGHPSLDLLLDLDAPANDLSAPDWQVHWERPVVVRGERVISGRFDLDPDLLARPSVVDLRLVQHDTGAAREVCVRVPVTGPDVTR